MSLAARIPWAPTKPAFASARMLQVTPVPAAKAASAPGTGDPDDCVLVARLAGGEADALADLYRRHGGACYRLACQLTANVTLAEDAVQEAFTGLWRNPARIPACQGQCPRLAAWPYSPQGCGLRAPGDLAAAPSGRGRRPAGT